MSEAKGFPPRHMFIRCRGFTVEYSFFKSLREVLQRSFKNTNDELFSNKEAILPIILYNKLVRDKIPEIIKHEGKDPTVLFLPRGRFAKALRKKLIEESMELERSIGAGPMLEELADVLEVLHSLAKTENIAWHRVEQKRKLKRKQRGGFKRRLFLRSVRYT